MERKYLVTFEDTLKGWQEDADELERKYGAEPLDNVLDKIRAEIKEQYGGCGLINDGLDMALSIIDKYMAESEDTNDN